MFVTLCSKVSQTRLLIRGAVAVGILSPEGPYTTRFHQKCRAVLQGLSDPAHRKGTQEVTVGNNKHIAMHPFRRWLPNNWGVPCVSNFFDESVDALCYVIRASAEGVTQFSTLPPWL